MQFFYSIIILLLMNSVGILVAEERNNYWDLFHLNYKRNSNDYYLDQCAKVYFIMGQLGIVNVLVFLDDSWPFSYKQATMLKQLKDRLERTGVPETLFFAIIKDQVSSTPSTTATDNNSNTETEAWAGVSPEEVIEITSNPNQILQQPLIKIISPDIFVIVDNEELNIWHELKGSRDQIIVLDRCGKLTYQIIIPWSILHFPYVKAAILSTHNDDPCDRCDSYATVYNYDDNPPENITSETMNSINDNEEMTMASNNELENSPTELSTQLNFETTINTNNLIPSSTNQNEIDNANIQIPGIRIIMRAPHYHLDNDSTEKHEYLVLKLNDEHFHGHLNGSVDNSYLSIINHTVDESIAGGIVFDKDESPGFYGEVADYWRDINNDYNIEEIPLENSENEELDGNDENFKQRFNDELITDEDDVGAEDFGATIENEEEESRNKLLAHYSRLLPWLYYVLD